MTAILPPKPGAGNAIVTPAKEPIGFPMLVLAAVIVAAGIYVVDQFDTRAGWLLAFLVLLGVAFGYKDFGNELTGLFGASVANQQTTPSTPPLQTSRPTLIPQIPPADTVIGPLGPVTA